MFSEPSLTVPAATIYLLCTAQLYGLVCNNLPQLIFEKRVNAARFCNVNEKKGLLQVFRWRSINQDNLSYQLRLISVTICLEEPDHSKKPQYKRIRGNYTAIGYDAYFPSSHQYKVPNILYRHMYRSSIFCKPSIISS